MIELWFETHGITVDNELGIATGWRDGALSVEGRRLAPAMGERRGRVDEVLASDLGRARETAALAFGGTGVPVRFDARLRECDYGNLTGMPVHRLATERRLRVDEPFPGGESYRQVAGRVAFVLQELALGKDRRTIVLIGHSATRWAIEHLLCGTPLEALVGAPVAWQEGWRYRLPYGWRAPRA